MTNESLQGVAPAPSALGRPIRPQRAAELVAADIRDRILRSEFDEGLPKEAVMLEEYAVSRPTLREALRILETEGLIQTRRGKQGGAVVRRPTPATAAYHLGLALQAAGADMGSLAEARRLLEPLCVSLAAQRPDRERVARELDALTDEAESLVGHGAEFTASLLRFHAALVEASANTTLQILVGTIETIWQGQERTWAEEAAAYGAYPDESDQMSGLESHRRIARRIARGDVEGATRAARNHLEASMRYVSNQAGGGRGQCRSRGRRRNPIVDASTLRV